MNYKTTLSMVGLWWLVRHGKWSCGLGLWAGKPMAGIFSDFYDGWHVCAHFGPLWVEIE